MRSRRASPDPAEGTPTPPRLHSCKISHLTHAPCHLIGVFWFLHWYQCTKITNDCPHTPTVISLSRLDFRKVCPQIPGRYHKCVRQFAWLKRVPRAIFHGGSPRMKTKAGIIALVIALGSAGAYAN